MKKVINLLFIIFFILMSSSLQAKDWELYAISGDVVMGHTYILLTWPYKGGVEGYNIYRKDNASVPFPKRPLNSSPVMIMTNCKEIESVIPDTSDEWKAISNALAVPAERIKRKIPLVPPLKPHRLLPGGYLPFNPCSVSVIRDTAETFQRLQALAHRYWKIGIIMGQAYVDSSVTVGTIYWYEIRGVDKIGKEIGILDTVRIEAGAITSLPAPSGVSAQAGDCKVQIIWDDVTGALGYDVYRSSLAAPPIKVNEAGIIVKCTTDLKGDTIPKTNCFIDFMRWGETGYPKKHEVAGDSIYGPYNGTNYFYKVRAKDILGRAGTWSSDASATPHDETPPAVPYDLTVEAYEDGLQVKWHKVIYDAKGHIEMKGIEGYWVYRFTSADSLSDSLIVSTSVLDTFGVYPLYKDTDPALRSEYGEKDYWYRVRSIDGSANKSAISPAAGGHLPDTTSPERPESLKADGHLNYIRLRWKKPGSLPPDLAGYNIYRGVCGGDSVCIDSILVGLEQLKWQCKEMGLRPYPLHLVGNVDDPDSLIYEDYSVPEGSPICYRYAVKAYDRSQNLSDTSRTICQRLREETPPPPPVISSLKARDRAIRIEWVAPPVQDLFGFVVERSESGGDPWIQVSDSLEFEEAFGCEDIPAVNIWAADCTFVFIDSTVVPKTTYYYRIRAADYGSNIGDACVPIETYTFSIKGPPMPYNLSVSQPSTQCALRVVWEPTYDTTYLGFIIFRSNHSDRAYRQISNFVKGNEFIDNKVMPNKEYWYKVQYFGKYGNRSSVSSSKNGMATP